MVGSRNIKVVSLKDLFKITLLVFLTLFLFSCSFQEMFDKMIPDDVEKFTAEYIEIVRSGDIEKALSLIYGSGESGTPIDQYRISLEDVSFYLNIGEVASTELVKVRFTKFTRFASNDKVPHTRYFQEFYITYSPDDRSFPDAVEKPTLGSDGLYHQSFNIVIDQRGDETMAAWVHVQNLIDSPVITSAFLYKIEYRPIWTFLFPLGVLVVPIFILYTAWVAFRTIKKRRWLWMLFVLFSFGCISIEWTAGAINLNVLSFNLLGAAAFKQAQYSPWVFTVGIPLGAILFRIKKKKFQETAQDPLPNTPEESVLPEPAAEG